MTEDGDSVEVAMIGNEGIVGWPLGATASPHTAIVVIPRETRFGLTRPLTLEAAKMIPRT